MQHVIVTKNPTRRSKFNKKLLTLCCLCWMAFGSANLFGQTTQEKFDQIVKDWKAAAKVASISAGKFYLAKMSEADALKDEWKTAVEEGQRQMEMLIPVTLELAKQPNPSQDVVQLVVRFAEKEFEDGNIEKAYELTELVAEHSQSDQRWQVVRVATAVLSNRFKEALRVKEMAPGISDMLEDRPANLLRRVVEMDELYQKELAIQEKEAKADDLPRVKIKTTKGSAIVELFENEAPNTVGNFIHLIENGVYQEMYFHRVIDQFMAQTGAFNSNGGQVQLPYTIYDECRTPEARLHFRGVLSMAKTPEPDTGGSQFFINFVPTPFLNNEHTVFGRVISGMDALDQITRTHEIDGDGKEQLMKGVIPDRVISITIERKRDHEYLPDKVKK